MGFKWPEIKEIANIYFWCNDLACHCKNLVVHRAMGCGQKKLSVSVVVPPAPVRVPSQSPLAPSVASVMSVANDKDDNEMVQGAVHRSPGICLTAEENPRIPQLGDRMMKELWTSHLHKWGPFPPSEVGRIAQHVRKWEGRN